MLRVPWKSASAGETPTEATTEAEPPRRRRLRRWLVATVVLVVLAAAGYFAYQQFFPTKAATPTVQTFAVRRGNIISTVAATGTVANRNVSRLSFPTSGTYGTTGVVTALNVSIGDSVKKGQILATLDATNLQLSVAQAQATLSSAQSKLAIIQAGPVASDVAAAQASLANAQANLDSVKAGATAADLSRQGRRSRPPCPRSRARGLPSPS